MDLLNSIGQNKFFARAGAHAYETIKNLSLFSIIFALLTATSHSDVTPQIQTKLDANATLVRQKGCAAKDQILQQLAQESEPSVRMNMLGILSSCHQQTTATSIEPFLNDSDPLVRSQAVITLGAIGGKQAVADLENVLTNDTNIGVRGTAATWLGSLQDPSAVSSLGQALQQEKDANVRIEIVQALKTIGTSAAKSALKKGQNDTDVRVKTIANE
jgi:HEAT repeat protein